MKVRIMGKLMELMEGRILFLRKQIRFAEKNIKNYPKGRLRISGPRHYWINRGDSKKEEYIKTGNAKLIKALAQKNYDERFLKMAQVELEALENAIRVIKKESAEQAYDGLSKSRKDLVEPYIIPDDEYVKAWLSQTFEENPAYPEKKRYSTKKGDKVRSKSEVIIADILYDLNIPYHYEKPVMLKNGEIRYPDFTLLDIRERKEVYYEHMGLLDDEDYLDYNLKKIEEYRNSGIYFHKNLIVTCEATNHQLDNKALEEMLKELFPTRIIT